MALEHRVNGALDLEERGALHGAARHDAGEPTNDYLADGRHAGDLPQLGALHRQCDSGRQRHRFEPGLPGSSAAPRGSKRRATCRSCPPSTAEPRDGRQRLLVACNAGSGELSASFGGGRAALRPGPGQLPAHRGDRAGEPHRGIQHRRGQRRRGDL